MMDDKNDRELRERFARLRSEELSRVPSFRSVRSRRVRSRAVVWPRVAMAVGAVVVAVVGLKIGFRGEAPDPGVGRRLDLSIPWESPTDFLLATPGVELLRTVPTLGGVDDWRRRIPTTTGRPAQDPARPKGRDSL
ncbi:MAG: hypothetical protein ACE5G2_02310 [Candidatus Krumholzibacteriia bacterium]